MSIAKKLALRYPLVNSDLLMGGIIAGCYDIPMSGVRSFRRVNLGNLIARYGGQRAFAERVGLSPAHVSQIMTGRRNVGDQVARRIEQALNRPPGWMDIDHSYAKDNVPELTPRQAILLDHFEALTEEQQGELLRELEEKKQRNEAIFEALSRKKAAKGAKV
jgi:transcriptional regulator with XRE-family HTH domain